MNSRQRAVSEFQRHECLGRKRTGQVSSFLAREAKARIVVWMPEHDDDAFPLVAESSQAAENQLTSNVAALLLGQNGHGSQ